MKPTSGRMMTVPICWTARGSLTRELIAIPVTTEPSPIAGPSAKTVASQTGSMTTRAISGPKMTADVAMSAR